MRRLVRIACFLSSAALGACSGVGQARDAASVQKKEGPLTAALDDLAAPVEGSLGACIVADGVPSCVNGDRPYALQSVVKLLVAVAVLDAVDRGEFGLSDKVVVRRSDLSLYVQPLARLVSDKGFETTIEDLVRRAVVDSDSAAADILIDRLGGPKAVQGVLQWLRIKGVRLDRNERDLQTESVGLRWKSEYTDADVLQRAIAAVPLEKRRQAHRKYLADVRDTSTPRGMALMLHRLASGELLSKASTAKLLDIMKQTRTFPTRLRAGAPAGWQVGHKTGSSGTYQGVVATTNDVGLYFPPAGEPIAIAVFLRQSPAPASERDKIIASVGRLASTHQSP